MTTTTKPEVDLPTYSSTVRYLLTAFPRGYQGLAVVSRSQAAKALKQTLSATDAQIRRKELGACVIGTVTCVCVESLLEHVYRYRDTVAQLREFLEQTAAGPNPRPVTYAEAMAAINLNPKSPPDRKEIGKLLGTVSEKTYRQTKTLEQPILLSAMVHLRASGMPSDAFFELAEKLGLATQDRKQLVENQLRAIFDRYRGLRSSDPET